LIQLNVATSHPAHRESPLHLPGGKAMDDFSFYLVVGLITVVTFLVIVGFLVVKSET
jgi:hypothetical protein